MPVISVIVPVYKVEQYLRECVDSILSQTFSDFELILVDDGSPDNCGAICDEYAVRDSRVRVIHQKNGGLSAARNAGIEIMRGQFVTFIDSDDCVNEKFLEILIHSIHDTNADIAICNYSRFEEDLPMEDSNIVNGTNNLYSGVEACRMLMEKTLFTVAWCKLYKTELFENIRYPVGVIHEDEATTYKLLYKAKLVNEISDELYYYRINANSIMNSTFSDKRYDSIAAFEERAVFYKQNGEQELYELTMKGIPVSIAKLFVLAAYNDAIDKVPSKYKMSVRKALRIIRKSSSDDNYSYYLAMVHPSRVRIHAYIYKIKSVLHIIN